MPNYPALVQLANRITAFGPYGQIGTILHSFCVDGDNAKIQAVLDAMFAAPSGGAVRYKALGRKLFVSVAQIAKVTSLNPIDAPHGYTPEVDICIWAIGWREHDGLFALRWIPLWLFVDSAPAMATGREVFGFPKQIGQFSFGNPDKPFSFAMNGFVLDPYAPDTSARWAPLMAIRPGIADVAPHPAGLLRTLADFATNAVERLAGDVGDMIGQKAFASVLAGGSLTLAFLKQFPDVADQTRACYQAIVEADATVTNFRSALWTAEHYELDLTSYASHPFQDQLGITPGWQDVGRGIRVDFDFKMDLGTEVWRAGPA